MTAADNAYPLINQLRQMGYAIAIFGPNDMPGDSDTERQANLEIIQRDLQDAMVARGNEFIEDYPEFSEYSED